MFKGQSPVKEKEISGLTCRFQQLQWIHGPVSVTLTGSNTQVHSGRIAVSVTLLYNIIKRWDVYLCRAAVSSLGKNIKCLNTILVSDVFIYHLSNPFLNCLSNSGVPEVLGWLYQRQGAPWADAHTYRRTNTEKQTNIHTHINTYGQSTLHPIQFLFEYLELRLPRGWIPSECNHDQGPHYLLRRDLINLKF